MPNYIAPGPKQGPQNGLSIQRATRCASRFPNWKMGSTSQGVLLGMKVVCVHGDSWSAFARFFLNIIDNK